MVPTLALKPKLKPALELSKKKFRRKKHTFLCVSVKMITCPVITRLGRSTEGPGPLSQTMTQLLCLKYYMYFNIRFFTESQIRTK